MITNKPLDTWQDLQKQVALILEESGLTAEIEKDILSVRGKIEIDVVASENIDCRTYSILIECKHWKSRIPKNVIHGFRTVVSDTGANIGYIISTNGFQSGSYEAAKYTNVRIVTWEEFQELFEEKWIENYFSKYIEEHFDSLITCTEPLVPLWALKLSGSDVTKMKKLRNKYRDLGSLLLHLGNPTRIFSQHNEYPKLPLRDEITADSIPKEILNAISYKGLLCTLHKYVDPAILEFHELRNKIL